MPTLISTGAIVQSTAWSQQGAQASLNIAGWRTSGLVGAPTLEDLADALQTSLNAVYAPFMANAAALLGVIVKQLTVVVTGQVLSTGAPVPGTGGATPAAAQASGIVTLTTGTPGRRGRGRKYIGFVAEALVTSAFQLTAPGLIALDTIGTFYGAPHTFVLLSGTVVLTPVIMDRAALAGSLTVTGIRARLGLATQRRRGSFGRPNTPPF